MINVPIKTTSRLDHKAKHNWMVHIRIISKTELLRKVEYKVMGIGISGKQKNKYSKYINLYVYRHSKEFG